MTDEKTTPYLAALRRYIAREILPFHTPGHKQGRYFPAALREFFPPLLLSLDLDPPLLPGEEGTGFAPDHFLEETQDRAARVFGACATFFLTNGTTVGILAAILAAAGPGDEIIVARPVHRSVVAALILSGARPVWWEAPWQAEWGLPLPPVPEDLRLLLDEHPGRPVFLTSPTYHGLMADLPQIVTLAQSRGSLVLVDEAHGPHLFFLGYPTAMAAGADLAAQSTHKLLFSLVGSSMLHVGQAGLVEKVAAALALVQSTSPSPFLLLSLEGVVEELISGRGTARLKESAALAEEVRRELARWSSLEVLTPAEIAPWAAGLDPLKITVRVDRLGMTGPQAGEVLVRAGVQVELAGLHHLLLVMGPGDNPATARGLLAALAKLERAGKKGRGQRLPGLLLPPPRSKMLLTPREAFFARRKTLPLQEAVGQAAATLVDYYPPGVPILIPGEEITPETLEHLRALRAVGLTVRGLSGKEGESIPVVDMI